MKVLGYAIISLFLICSTLVTSEVIAEEGEVLTLDGAPQVIELTLDDVIQDVIEHNTSVVEAREEWLISKRNALAAWGDFEPYIVANYDKNRLKRENDVQEILQQGGSTGFSENNWEYGVGIEGKFFTGATYQAGYTMNRIRNNLNNTDEFKSFVGGSIEQPLLKNFWFGAPLANIRVADKDTSIAFHNYRSQLMSSIVQVESAYWKLVFSQERYKMAFDSLEIAKKIVQDSEERVKVGKMSELDLLEAESGVAIREAYLADSEQDILESNMQLKLLLSNETIGFSTMVKAADTLDNLLILEDKEEKLSEQGDDLKKNTIDLHPEFMVKQEELKKEDILYRYYKGQMLPDLKAKASYGFNGLALNQSKSFSKMADADFPAWSVGVEVKIPLFLGIKERNEMKAAKRKKMIAKKLLAASEYELNNSITTLHQRIDILKKRVQNNEVVVKFRERLLDVEMERLKAGKSNTRLVFEKEEELTESKQRKLDSIINYQDAVMQLAFLEGTILMDRNLEIIKNGRPILVETLETSSI